MEATRLEAIEREMGLLPEGGLTFPERLAMARDSVHEHFLGFLAAAVAAGEWNPEDWAKGALCLCDGESEAAGLIAGCFAVIADRPFPSPSDVLGSAGKAPVLRPGLSFDPLPPAP